jgi:hypothetical protein
MFYNKQIEIWNIGEGYKDVNKIYHERNLEKTKTLMVDVQPYSTERLKKDYGYEIDVNKRIFCNLDSSIDINTVIIYTDYNNKNLKLEVKKILPWDDYMEVFCLEVIRMWQWEL